MEPRDTTRWSPLVVTGAGATVLIDRASAPAQRRAIQLALDAADPVVGFLSTITANGVHDLPPFAYVGREGSIVRILLRGGVVAAVRDAAGAEVALTAGSVSTWNEVVRSDCVDVELRSGGEAIAVISYGVPNEEAVEEAVEEPSSVGELERQGAAAAPASPEAPSVNETILPGRDFEPPGRVAVSAAAGSGSPPVSDDEVDLSHLFETRHVGVEAAAVREDTPGSEVPVSDPAESRQTFEDLASPTGASVVGTMAPPPPGSGPSGSGLSGLASLPPPTGPPVAVPPPAGLIAGVPGSLAAAPPPGPTAPPPAGDHDGLTISPAQLAALRSGMSGAGASAGGAGPQLQAVSCPSGHLNPPQADRCRACGGPIADWAIRLVNRPSLGHLSFEGGTVVDIDRPLLIGRKPTVDGLASGAEVPGLVVLPDPEGSLSRVHAEVRIEGWEVLVVDRSSTNGTFVEIPGQPPVMLRPMEPCLISPGTKIAFADVATCAFQTGPR